MKAQINSVFKMAPTAAAQDNETRCECGQLVAKLRPEGVELKCKRCKRLVIIPYSQSEGRHVNL